MQEHSGCEMRYIEFRQFQEMTVDSSSKNGGKG